MPYIDLSPTTAAVRIPDGAAEELLIDIVDAVREPLLVTEALP